MFEFTESVPVDAPPELAWTVMRDVEGWWLASNPQHESLELLDDRDVLEVGTRLKIREKIAGIPGEAVGEITRVEPGSTVSWEAPQARYRLLGLSLSVGEGVTWGIEPRDGGAIVRAHVWATFPPGPLGRAMEWFFTRVLKGVEKDREHARTELRYLKRLIESRSAR